MYVYIHIYTYTYAHLLAIMNPGQCVQIAQISIPKKKKPLAIEPSESPAEVTKLPPFSTIPPTAEVP